MKQTTKKRVLFFQHSGAEGGAPRSLLQIIKEYEREFGPQKVLFLRSGPALEQYRALASTIEYGRWLLPFHGTEVSVMNWKTMARNVIGLFTAPYVFARWLRGNDVIHFNSSILCFYGLVVRCFSPSTRIVYHIREPLLKNIWGETIRWALKHSADHLIAISANEKRSVNLPEIPTDVVHNYVHSADYVPVKGESLHRQDPHVGMSKFVVGYFARVELKNGLLDFIELANRFQHDTGMAFCIYGYTGHERKKVLDAIAAAPANVFLYPMVADVVRNLSDIDVLVVPFKVPHFSRSVIEAAMLAVPSVIYDHASINETVIDGETGYVVPINDLTALTRRVSDLRGNLNTHSRLSKGAREFALESFSERNYAKIRDVINA